MKENQTDDGDGSGKPDRFCSNCGCRTYLSKSRLTLTATVFSLALWFGPTDSNVPFAVSMIGISWAFGWSIVERAIVVCLPLVVLVAGIFLVEVYQIGEPILFFAGVQFRTGDVWTLLTSAVVGTGTSFFLKRSSCPECNRP